MPSSTSSFERSVPRGSWASSFWIAAVIAAVVLIGWEIYCRSQGYAPTLNDTSDLWAARRTELKNSGSDRTAIIGSSRILFDFDLGVYADYFQTETPIQLAMPGTTPLVILEHLAEDETFRGTLLCGITPGLFFVPEGMPVENAEAALSRYKNWSPSQRSDHVLGVRLQNLIAFIQQEDLTLNALLASLRIPNRKGAQIPPEIPGYFARMEESRQAWMWEKCTFGSPLAKRIQDIWIPLFTPPPPPPMFTPEEWKEMYMQSVQSYLDRAGASVAKIRERGGKVVFIRSPSTDTLREMEQKYSPRQGFWDRILAATGTPGIHFEDYEELSGFDCPEWSHLTAEDATRFTKNLMPILAAKLSEL
jgi:hypothetical protein